MNVICVRKQHGVDGSRLSLCVLPFMTPTLVRVTELRWHHSCVGLAKRWAILFDCCMKIQPSSLGICSLFPVISFPAFKWEMDLFPLLYKLIRIHRVQTICMVCHYVRLRDKNIKNSMGYFFKPAIPTVFRITETFPENSNVLWIPRTKFYH